MIKYKNSFLTGCQIAVQYKDKATQCNLAVSRQIQTSTPIKHHLDDFEFPSLDISNDPSDDESYRPSDDTMNSTNDTCNANSDSDNSDSDEWYISKF